MKTTALLAPLVALALLGSQALASQQVLVVDDDGGPGVDFNDLATAVVAAAPGDVLLIRTSDFASSVLVDKPLSLIADAGATVSLPSLTLRDVAAGEIVVHGLQVGSVFGVTVDLINVAAPVLLQDCTLQGGIATTHAGAGVALSARDCPSLTVANCTIRGGLLAAGTSGSFGVNVTNTTLALFGTTVEAAGGASGMLFSPAGTGGDALLAVNSFVFSQGTTLRGGAGGNGGTNCVGGDGGAGVVLLGTSELRTLDSEVAGGAGGTPENGCAAGVEGEALELGTGVLVQHAGSAVVMDSSPVLREQELATVSVQGQPGDLIVMGLGLELAPLGFFGALVSPLAIAVPSSALRHRLGFVPASGTLSLSFPIDDLPVGAQALGLQLQPAAFRGSEVLLGNTRRMAVLDSSL